LGLEEAGDLGLRLLHGGDLQSFAGIEGAGQFARTRSRSCGRSLVLVGRGGGNGGGGAAQAGVPWPLERGQEVGVAVALGRRRLGHAVLAEMTVVVVDGWRWWQVAQLRVRTVRGAGIGRILTGARAGVRAAQ